MREFLPSSKNILKRLVQVGICLVLDPFGDVVSRLCDCAGHDGIIRKTAVFPEQGKVLCFDIVPLLVVLFSLNMIACFRQMDHSVFQIPAEAFQI